MTFKSLSFIVLATLVAIAISGTFPHSTYAVYNEMGCDTGCAVAGAGFPFAFIMDYPGLSPVGSVSWLGLFEGLDKLNTQNLIFSALVWAGLAGVVVVIFNKLTSRLQSNEKT